MNHQVALVRLLLNSDASSSVNEFVNWLVLASHSPSRPKLYLCAPQSNSFVEYGSNLAKGIQYSQVPENNRRIVCARGSFVVGYVEWQDEPRQLLEEHRAVARSIIDEIYRRAYFANYLSRIRKPIDFTKQDKYFRDTAELISEVLQMELVAIRQINDAGDLHCSAFYQYPGAFLPGIDFLADSLPPPFEDTIRAARLSILNRRVEDLSPSIELVNSADERRYSFLGSDPLLAQIKTFVLFPVVVGDEFLGVISCASRIALNFADLERSAVSTAMHLFAVAVSNFNRYHETKRLADVIHEQLFSMTHMEVTQSAKHELMNIEAEQALHIDELRDFAKTVKDRDFAACVDKLGVSVEHLTGSIKKLGWNGFVAAPRIDLRSIESMWNQAISLLSARLEDNGIRHKFIGPDVKINLYPDWLKDAFLNLLLNSIDAFKERPKQHRAIQLNVRHENSDANKVVLDYSDNAGGVNFAKILVPDGIQALNPGMRPEEVIFQAKVTSKKRRPGSGWGLYLVRQAVGLHKGSVYLRSSTKDGVTFRITLSRLLQPEAE